MTEYGLAPFYTRLEDAFRRDRILKVPLVPNAVGTPLQRQWAEVARWFEPTHIVDEAVSLLVGIAFSSDHVSAAMERRWAEQEAAEVPGFAEEYGRIRSGFAVALRATRDGGDERARRQLAEDIIQYGRLRLSEAHAPEFPPHLQPIPDDMPVPRRSVRWPPLLGNPSNRARVVLAVNTDLTGFINITSGMSSLAEATQQTQALLVREEENEKSFLQRTTLWEAYASFSVEEGGNVAPIQITAIPSGNLLVAAMTGIRGRDGARLEKATGELIGAYVLFLEAMRQQICTGVGLRCPFWDGAQCCQFRPLLARIRDLTQPSDPGRPHHWQAPPCLDSTIPRMQ